MTLDLESHQGQLNAVSLMASLSLKVDCAKYMWSRLLAFLTFQSVQSIVCNFVRLHVSTVQQRVVDINMSRCQELAQLCLSKPYAGNMVPRSM